MHCLPIHFKIKVSNHDLWIIPPKQILKEYTISLGHFESTRELDTDTCLPMCMNEEVTLTAFDACSKHYRHRDELTWCRRGYDNTFESMALLLGAQDQESDVSIHDESINIAT